MSKPNTPADFWDRVDKAGECWTWRGYRYRGYGYLDVLGKQWRAHRYAYYLTHGEIPAGKVVRHTCDNPPCVNPAHLLIGSQADNSRDCVERGRIWSKRGETHCPNGHAWDQANTARGSNGAARRCRQCTRAASRAYYQRNRERLVEAARDRRREAS